MHPYHEDLNRIAEQAQLLENRARQLDNLKKEKFDLCATSPTQQEITEATRQMHSAFMAVIRVTAEYL